MYVQDKKSFTYVNKSNVNSLRLVQQTIDNNGIVAYVDKTKLPSKFQNKVEKAGSITINPDQPLSFYQDEEFIGNSVIILNHKNMTKSFAFFVISELRKIRKGSLWSNKFPKNIVEITNIQLPTKNDEIDFEFMESFVAELETQRVAELEAYLTVTGLKDYELTADEEKVVKTFEELEWEEFKVSDLFGKATRGKRLKSADRIQGDLIFVTAGETNQGISAYIGNDVEVFLKNTITIDMFGSAKYRNYEYGADDHVAIVHTESLPQSSVLFITTAIHKSSYNGQFSYSRNFYAKDADELIIQLPVIDGEINYNYMETFITAIKKLVIKDMVKWTDKKIGLTKDIVNTKYNSK